ncbi:MAG TPA: hypothetical protein PKN30_15620 [Flavobacteriales bacterium]|nr:hypothetical protein [Flavobacteriales bacterium]
MSALVRPSLLRPHTSIGRLFLLLVLAFGGPIGTTSAQYFLKHFPAGGAVSLVPMPGGGVRAMAATGDGTELELDANGQIMSSTLVEQTIDGSTYLRRMLPFGPGARLGFGGFDHQDGPGILQSILLARVPDGATTANAVAIGTPNGYEYNGDVVVTPGEGVVVTGRIGFGSSPTIRYHLLVGKFDMDLNAMWLRTVDVQEKNLTPLRVFVDPTTDVITCFTRQSAFGAVDNTIARVRLSPNGDLLDCIVYDYAGNGWENADVVPLEDGAYLMLHELTGFADIQLVCTRIEADGQVAWSRIISAPGDTDFASCELYNGALYAVGTTSTDFSNEYVVLMKLDLEGEVLWTHTYGIPERWSRAYCLAVAPDATGAEAIWIGGTYRLNGTSPQEVLIMKVDGNGEGLPCTQPDLVFTTTATEISISTGATIAPYTAVSTFNMSVGTYPAQEVTSECVSIGLDEVDAGSALRAAPVPTTGLCTIHLPPAGHPRLLRLIDARGRKVQEVLVAGHATTALVDLSALHAGPYTVLVSDRDRGSQGTVRIVKE